MTMANAEWDDLPTTSELFGGDFFGDELMEMYSAIGDAPPPAASALPAETSAAAPPAAAEDDKASSHPGLLIAMNAAAMDGGLSPLGSGAEQFVPLAATSDAAAEAAATAPPPAAPPVAVEVLIKVEPTPVAASPSPTPIETAAPVPAPAAPVPVAVTSAPAPVAPKRSAALVAAPTSAPNPPKKLKGGAFPLAGPKAKVAASGGIKVSLSPGTLANGTRPMGRAVSSSSLGKTSTMAAPAPVGVRPPGTIAPPPKKVSVAAAQAIKATVVPKCKMPGGGISHQVVARPSVVQSAATVGVHRIMPPAPSLSAAGIRHAVSTKKVDLPQTTPSGVIRAKSEADFKDVASAAVSSLIQNASSALAKAGPKPPSAAVPVKPGAVDVSTAHINALTSQNWVTACNPIPAPDVSVVAPGPAAACDKAARNARRAALTQEERAKQNRDRNREHARNTRLRKKAYVEELKRTLTELVAQRDAAELERRHEAQRNREQREVRFRVMEEFLKLRGRNEPNAARWVAILEDGFTFTLPRTSFRRMVEKSSNDVNGTVTPPSSVEQVLRGATAVMEDSQHLSSYLQSVGGTSAGPVSQVQIAYRCDRKRFFMDCNVAFMDFHASTVGAVARGSLNEASFRGSARATFSPASNKLISVDVEFDTAVFVQQVEAMGDASCAAAAVAAHEADALLDSLQMPQIYVDKKDVPAAKPAPGPASVSSDDGERSTDGSTALLSA